MTHILRRAGIIAFSIFAVFPGVVSAQVSQEGLTIKPAIIEDNVSLGGVSQFSVTVKNIGATERTFYLSVKDIKGLTDDGKPVFAQEGEQTGYELGSWIAMPQGAITLQGGETKTITFSVHVPNRVSPGAHFGGIFLTNAPGTVANTTGSEISYSVGSILSLKIAGDTHEDAQIREFATDKLVYGTGNANFITKIENSGNVLVRPHGVIQITDMFGRSAGSVEVNGTGAPVFPGSSRKFSGAWLSDGFAFGRYEAVGSFQYGDTESKTISATTSFWVLPLKPVAIALGAILAIIVGMYIAIKFYIRRKLQDMGVDANSRDANYYARKYQRSGSRMIVVTLVVFLVCLLFLAALFLAFA